MDHHAGADRKNRRLARYAARNMSFQDSQKAENFSALMRRNSSRSAAEGEGPANAMRTILRATTSGTAKPSSIACVARSVVRRRRGMRRFRCVQEGAWGNAKGLAQASGS